MDDGILRLFRVVYGVKNLFIDFLLSSCVVLYLNLLCPKLYGHPKKTYKNSKAPDGQGPLLTNYKPKL
jgi:hypothetical protein